MTTTVETFKRDWLAALRSGNFFQCSNNLFGDAERNKDGSEIEYSGDDEEDYQPRPGHCCLGVGLEITGGDTAPLEQDGEMPSRAWCARYGLRYEDAESLAAYNDGGSSFEYIADIIEFIDLAPYELDLDGDEITDDI